MLRNNDIKKVLLAIYLLLSIIPLVNAWEWCNKEGYQYCVEQTELVNGINLTSKIAVSLYDYEGNPYDEFIFSGFAIKGFYANIYYEGEQLYYTKNLSDWNEACDDELISCQGTIIRTNNQTTTLTLGNIYDEYIGCPLFISLKCDEQAEWCEWAGMGYIKPINNTCSHIRVAECFYDDDCLTNQYCDKTNKINWETWTCKEIPLNSNITELTKTKREVEGYTTAKISAGGYSPTYDVTDVKKSIIDIIIGILKGIGQLFGGS
jgi:hypothetical protein